MYVFPPLFNLNGSMLYVLFFLYLAFFTSCLGDLSISVYKAFTQFFFNGCLVSHCPFFFNF